MKYYCKCGVLVLTLIKGKRLKGSEIKVLCKKCKAKDNMDTLYNNFLPGFEKRKYL